MIIFTGTADQQYWKQKIYEVFLLNELGPNPAYALRWAGTAGSGYSFGYVQWDLAKNPTARTILQNILENATNATEQYIVQDNNPNTERANDNLIISLMNEVNDQEDNLFPRRSVASSTGRSRAPTAATISTCRPTCISATC